MNLILLIAIVHPLADTTISTVAGNGESKLSGVSGPALEFAINQPFGVEFGPDRALYICEVGNHRVLRLDPKTSRVTTVAGNGEKGITGDGGPATKARLSEPYEVRFDAGGNMYFVEMVGAVVSMVEKESGILRRIAGTGEGGFSGDGGPAVKAKLSSPHSIALDGKSGLYIADIGNHRIRRVDLKTGIIESIAGNGERVLPKDGAVATGRPMLGPRALFITGNTMWIALREGHSVWKMDLTTRNLTHVAGDGTVGYRDGAGDKARFNGPKGIAVGPRGDVYVVDTENQAIRRIERKGFAVSTIAGYGPSGRGYGGDGGSSRKAKLDRPHGVAVAAAGAVYIGDSNNHRVRKVTAGAKKDSR